MVKWRAPDGGVISCSLVAGAAAATLAVAASKAAKNVRLMKFPYPVSVTLVAARNAPRNYDFDERAWITAGG